jgi:hypothetical protein
MYSGLIRPNPSYGLWFMVLINVYGYGGGSSHYLSHVLHRKGHVVDRKSVVSASNSM